MVLTENIFITTDITATSFFWGNIIYVKNFGQKFTLKIYCLVSLDCMVITDVYYSSYYLITKYNILLLFWVINQLNYFKVERCVPTLSVKNDSVIYRWRMRSYIDEECGHISMKNAVIYGWKMRSFIDENYGHTYTGAVYINRASPVSRARVTNIFSRPQKKIWIKLRMPLHLN